MFIPVYDGRPLAHISRPYFTWLILAVNIAIYFTFQQSVGIQASAVSFGLIPAIVSDIMELPAHLAVVPEDFTYITYAFLHGDFMHLLGNMLFFWVFADNVEDALGHAKFLIFFALCAIAGGLLHVLVTPESTAPLIGASGAVAGVVAAYLILHPHTKVWILAFGRLPLRLSAFWCLGLWIAFQFFQFFAAPESQVSWAAHIGGIVAGAILVMVLKKPDVQLFDRGIRTAP